jgi:hypothetical protein
MASQIKVDNIEARTTETPTQLVNGAIVSSGYALTCSGGINITGVLTATSFTGDGSGLTNLDVASEGQTIALYIIT